MKAHTIESTKKYILDNIIVTESGCWEWQKCRNLKGYGRLNRHNQNLAHRVSYVLFKGHLDNETCILHKCDNPPCVNPDHFTLGSIQDNNKDCKIKGRLSNQNKNKPYCKRGHELSGENIKITKRGTRRCKQCDTLTARIRYLEKIK